MMPRDERVESREETAGGRSWLSDCLEFLFSWLSFLLSTVLLLYFFGSAEKIGATGRLLNFL
jgi:hypothetical protein